MTDYWIRLLSCAAIFVLVGSSSAAAQLVLPGAGEDKFGLITGGNNTVTLTTSGDGVSFNWSTAKYTTRNNCDQYREHTPELVACLMKLEDGPLSFDFSAGVTGEKGKGGILSKGLLNPGVLFSMAAVYRHEPDSTKGYTDFYGTVTGSVTQEHVANLATAGSASIDDTAEKKFGVGLGVNRFFNEHFALGAAGNLTRALSTPGTRSAISLCDTTTGVNSDGHTIEASDCEDGFVAPLADQWVRSLRGEVMYNFDRFGSTASSPTPVLTVGIIGSLNVTYRTDLPRIGNLAFGPVLHPRGIPHKALVALVMKYSDITNAATGTKTIRERFGAVLWFGIPLTNF